MYLSLNFCLKYFLQRESNLWAFFNARNCLICCLSKWGGGDGSLQLLVRRSWVWSSLWQPTPYWLGRCQYDVTSLDRCHGLIALSCVWQHVKLSDVSLGTCPRYSLVVDEESNQTKQSCLSTRNSLHKPIKLLGFFSHSSLDLDWDLNYLDSNSISNQPL